MEFPMFKKAILFGIASIAAAGLPGNRVQAQGITVPALNIHPDSSFAPMSRVLDRFAQQSSCRNIHGGGTSIAGSLTWQQQRPGNFDLCQWMAFPMPSAAQGGAMFGISAASGSRPGCHPGGSIPGGAAARGGDADTFIYQHYQHKVQRVDSRGMVDQRCLFQFQSYQGRN